MFRIEYMTEDFDFCQFNFNDVSHALNIMGVTNLNKLPKFKSITLYDNDRLVASGIATVVRYLSHINSSHYVPIK